MKANLLFISFLLSSFGLKAQTEVTPYKPGVTVEGVTYYLPKTAIRLVVQAEKQVYSPGEFRDYANLYLSLRNIPKEASTKWSIKSITMDTYGVPDPTKIYNIKLQKRTVAPLVGLSADGLLLSVNTEGSEEVLPELPKPVPAQKRKNPRDYMDREMLSASSSAKMAELVADEIYEIRDSRNALIRGEADNTPKDGTQLKLMLDNLQLQEEAFLQMFRGCTEVSTEVFCIDIVPETELDKMVLFRFSNKFGVVDNDDLSGEPVYITVKDLKTVPEPVVDEKAAKKKQKLEKGISYNVPSRAKVSVYAGDKTYSEGTYPFAQFGNVEILSDVLFDKNATTQVTFFQNTGGIEQISEGFSDQ